MGLDLRGTVSLDGSGWEAGLRGMERGVGRSVESLKGLAVSAFGVYGLEQAFHKTVETAEKLVDTSRRVGVSVEALQELGFAAKQNGADIEQLTLFIEKLNSARIDPKKVGSFGKLGIDPSDLKSLKAEDLIMKLSANVQKRSSQEVIGPLRDIGGRGAGALLPMLKENLEEVRAEAERLGVVMKTEDAVMLKFLADEMKVLSQVIISALAPAIVFAMEKFMAFANQLKAGGTFWGNFTAKGGFKELGEVINHGLLGSGLKSEEAKAAAVKLKGIIAESGAQSETELSTLTDATAAQIKALLDKQKGIEAINEVPDFGSVMEKPKARSAGGFKDYSDSLTRVGNFLGGSANPLVTIAQHHTHLLQQIVSNTAPRAVNNSGTSFPRS